MSQVDIDTTIAALQKGLTAIPTDQAVSVIDSWQQQLQGNPLAEQLGELKAALSSGGTSKGKSLTEILTTHIPHFNFYDMYWSRRLDSFAILPIETR